MYRNKRDVCLELERWMKNNHYSQEYVAIKMEIDQPYLSRLLSNHKDSFSKCFIKLCNYANIDIYDRSKYDPLEDDELRKTIRLFVGNNRVKTGLVTNLVKALGDGPWELH